MIGRVALVAALVGCTAPAKRPAATRPMPEPTAGPHPGVDETIARERWRMKECFNHALAKDPRSGGRYKIRFETNAEGSIIGAWIVSSEGTASLGDCIAKSFLTVKFPPAPAVFTVPFVLTSTLSPMLCTPGDSAEECDLIVVDQQALSQLATKNPDDVMLAFRVGARNAEIATAALWRPARSIAIRSPYVDDISSLAPLKDLEILALTPTKVTDISVVRSLPKLQALYLPATADPTPAFEVKTLEALGLGRDLADWTQLAKLPALRILQLLDSQLGELSQLSSLVPALTQLRLHRPHLLTSIAPVATLTNLEELSLVESKVTSIGALSSLTKLKVVNLSRSPVSDLSPLAKHTGLTVVRLGGTNVSQLWPLLASAASLRTLVIPKDLSEDAVASFRAMNPKLTVWRE